MSEKREDMRFFSCLDQITSADPLLTKQPLAVIRFPMGTGFLASREDAQDSKCQPRILLVKCLL